MLSIYDISSTQFLGTSVSLFVKGKNEKGTDYCSAYFTGFLKYGSDEIVTKDIMNKL